MSIFIRKKKTKGGGIAVQIIYKQGRVVNGLTHIGTAHGEAELKALLALAHEKIHENQIAFDFANRNDGTHLYLEKSYSELLWNTLSEVYDHLGFGRIGDHSSTGGFGLGYAIQHRHTPLSARYSQQRL
jgi:hypothetical protein